MVVGAPGAAAEPLEAGLSALAARHAAVDEPGCVLAVRSGKDQALRAFGRSSIELGVANSADTVFHAGSIAKQFTAAAVLLLEADGKLSIEDPITKLVPELAATGGGIRIRHLLEHTSGIRDYSELLFISGGLDTGIITPETMLDLLSRQRRLNFPPGTRFSYSNSGYWLLGLIVQRASGQSLADFAAARIFQPLGMMHTRFLTDHATIVPGRAQGYRRSSNSKWQRSDYLIDVYGDGGLFTTAGDLMRWVDNLHSGEVGGRQLVARLRQTTRLADGQTVPWGLGLEVRSTPHGQTIGHGGRDFGFQAYMLDYPERGVTAVSLCNARDIDAYELANSAASLALPLIAAAPGATGVAPVPISKASPTVDLRPYEGTYFSPTALALRKIVVRDGQLVWSRGKGTVLEPTGPNRFRFAGAPITVVFSGFKGSTPQIVTVVNSTGPSPVTTVYDRTEPASPDLRQYLGTYRSDETGTQYKVERSTEERALAFRASPSFAFDATSLFLDGFGVGEDVIIRFQRNGGRISSMTVSTDRAQNVLFVRADGASKLKR
jgi:CubicO group peptidase (beta-lactamase class C family)